MIGRICAAIVAGALALSGSAQAATTLNLVPDGHGEYRSSDFYWPSISNGSALAFAITFEGLVLTSGHLALDGELDYRLWDPLYGNDLPYAHNSDDIGMVCGTSDGCIRLTSSHSAYGRVRVPADINNPCGPGTPIWTTCTQTFTPNLLVADFTFRADGSGKPPSATLRFITTAAPEPGTWAMMIAGFGLAGTALRRRRIVAAA